MSTQRTPPQNISTLTRSESERSISAAMSDGATDALKVTHRYKRFRYEDEPRPDVMTEMRELFNELKEDQNKRFEVLQATVSTISTQNKEISASAILISQQYDDMKIKLDNLEKERKCHLAYIQTLEQRIDYLENQNRSSCVEFRNIPLKKRRNKV
ncbi:unnamed protein product [Chilo suppressalis]|uniref:Uncharacterized protein n=1 Tax=Chilo suppressalis TaxID=168631 RepID=A0ABN8B7Z4_CHISP|nr:unnamed protein product [Chilo suppressalis]